MSKIIQAINSMIENSKEISNVMVKGSEYFFSYKGYIWSIFQYSVENRPPISITIIPIYTTKEAYSLVFYPKVKTIEQLEKSTNPRSIFDYILYSSEDFKTKEALESFANLYTIIKEKVYGVDTILDDIIKSSKEK